MYAGLARSSIPRTQPRTTRVHARKTSMKERSGSASSGDILHLELNDDGTNKWRLEGIAEMLRDGAVGIIPTDSFPAIVCSLEDLGAAQRLAAIANITSREKKLSIMCRGFNDVDTYTMGFPPPHSPGAPDIFRIAKKALPGAYTLILRASKYMPKQALQDGKKSKRTSVGVRMPDDWVCRDVLDQLEAPLLCTSAHVQEDEDIEVEIPDAGTMMDIYPGVDFVVDVGRPRIAQPSTVIDLTSGVPEVLREGVGDPEPFVQG